MRRIVCLLFVFLFIGGIFTPFVGPPTIAADENAIRENTFLPSSDGDESSESITSFSETLDDDVLFYPDTFINTTIDYADEGAIGGTGGGDDDITETYVQDNGGSGTGGLMYEDFAANNDGWLTLNFTVPNSGTGIDGFDYAFYARCFMDYGVDEQVQIYDFTAADWVRLSALSLALAWHNDTLCVPDYWDTVVYFRFLVPSQGVLDGLIGVDYAELTWYHMTLANADHYAESFADVSDWDVSAGTISISTDGDVMSHEADSWQHSFTNDISLVSMEGYYVEYRLKANKSHPAGTGRIFGYHADDKGGGMAFYDNVAWTTSWQTFKTYLPSSAGYDAGALESISFSSGYDNVKLEIDYLGISPPDECGWQHDGSTTEGITDDGQANVTYSYSSHGDILTINGTRTAAVADYMDVWFEYDTTSTVADIELDYYQVLTFSVDSFSTVGCGITWGFIGDGKLLSSQVLSTGINRANIAASTGSNPAKRILWFSVSGVDNGDTFEIVLDWCKAVSIANYTYASSGVGADDYLYVDSGVLCSHIDSGTIELNYDPALSVSDSYPVYNLTTSGTAPEFSQYVSSWTDYSDDTRGATSSGTVTDIKLRFDATEDLSEIKFVEDATAPNADIVLNTLTPSDDEQITLSSIVFDDVEVWKVWYNAISYPETGYTDIDYEATEGQENYWSYTFDSLPQGDYCFKVIANDGANNSTIDSTNRDYALIRFTVRESEIDVDVKTLLGAGSDFTMMTLSAHINKDCTYTIYEESASNAETDTYAGSVSSPSFNLAWTKLDTTDTNVNFTIVFMNATLTYNYTSQYQVAQTTFYLEWAKPTESYYTVTVTGYATKTCSYTVYIEDVYQGGGTISDNEFDIAIDKQHFDGSDHDYAILFTNGTQTTWYNSTYYGWKHNPDAAAAGTPDYGLKDRQTIEFWTFVGVVLGGLAVLMIFVSHHTRGGTK